jgi:N-acetylmuramoyl-L-alanine amidase
MTKTQPPNVPYVEAQHQGSKQKPTSIRLHLSSTTSDKGAALGIANRLHQTTSPLISYHYIVDEAEIYRCVWDNVAAYSQPWRSLNIMICSEPMSDVQMWSDSPQADVLHRTADLVATLVLTHKIRVRHLDLEAELKWRKRRWRRQGGIALNILGAWPREAFLSDVESQIVLKTM